MEYDHSQVVPKTHSGFPPNEPFRFWIQIIDFSVWDTFFDLHTFDQPCSLANKQFRLFGPSACLAALHKRERLFQEEG